MRARELLDEVPDLDHTTARLRHLLIEPKTPGEITTSRLAVQGFEFYCIILNVSFRSGKTFADELLRLAPQGACDFIEPEFGVVLHAPKHPVALPDLCRLHIRERVRRKQHRAFGEMLHLVGVEGRRVVYGWAACQERVRAPDPGWRDPAGERCLTAILGPAHRSADRDGGNLEAGARPERWGSRPQTRRA